MKHYCSLCGKEKEAPPATHDLAKCEKTELLNGRETIKKLTQSLVEWKDTWFSQRDLIGRLCWEHSNCPHEIKVQQTSRPHGFSLDKVVQQGKQVWQQEGATWKLIGEGTSEEAAKNIVRLMNQEEK